MLSPQRRGRVDLIIIRLEMNAYDALGCCDDDEDTIATEGNKNV